MPGKKPECECGTCFNCVNRVKSQKWRAKNRLHYNQYQREYLRRYRARKKAERQWSGSDS